MMVVEENRNAIKLYYDSRQFCQKALASSCSAGMAVYHAYLCPLATVLPFSGYWID